ncbi:MAG: phosphate transport system substrate-binding protein [Gallionellaceae bacterium]|nr:MAG: phosphate transport system substrate-binding protein [Gallionellaceae bacterium]
MSKMNSILRIATLSAVLAVSTTALATDITGAGATFPYPIYAKWAEAYKAQTGAGMNYQSIGSGGGIKQIQAKTVDFGASDAPLHPEELAKNGLTQFPTVIGGVVPVVNLESVSTGTLKLTSQVLADIYQGKITKWNDSRIVADNAGLSLPDKTITVVHRADGSGTTFIFTTYLAQVSTSWKTDVGADKAVKWPVGTGGKGNEGVASFVQTIKNSIGYVEYAYALQNKMNFVQLKNRDGQFVKPNDDSFKAAAANAKWDKNNGFYEILTNEPGKASWPITGATFVLIPKSPEKIENAKEVLKFFDWAYANGDKMASDLDYVPLPAKLKATIHDAWKEQVKDSSGKALWK